MVSKEARPLADGAEDGGKDKRWDKRPDLRDVFPAGDEKQRQHGDAQREGAVHAGGEMIHRADVVHHPDALEGVGNGGKSYCEEEHCDLGWG